MGFGMAGRPKKTELEETELIGVRVSTKLIKRLRAAQKRQPHHPPTISQVVRRGIELAVIELEKQGK